MELSGRIALLVFSAVLAGVIGYSAANAADAYPSRTSVANDEAAFNQLRGEIQRKNQAKEDARRPVQRTGAGQPGGCQIKPVMSDAEITACRRH